MHCPAAGSSLATRKAAAAQIAAIAGAHPAQLPAVVAAVARHLRHNDWDARVAAGHCLGLLAEHFQHHTPADLASAVGSGGEGAAKAAAADVKQEGAGEPAGDTAAAAGAPAEPALHLLSFTGFNVRQVLSQGTPMLASGGEVSAGVELPRPGAGHTPAQSAPLGAPQLPDL